MAYRAITIAWLPRSASGWRTFAESRKEAARLWADLTERHFRIRRWNMKWPSKARWQQWAKGRYPGLHSQSVQQIIGEFCEAVQSARQLRKNGDADARYPWKKPRYRDVVYTNQAPRFKDGWMLLPNGTSGTLRVRLPDGVTLPGRLMEVRLASLGSKQAAKEKGSQRWKRLQKRKRRLLAKADRRIKDLLHKGTRQIANAFPGAKCYVGKPFNDAARKARREQAQTVSQASNAKLIRLLDYKTAGAIEVEEHYSSQTCPVCGGRRQCRRTYRCACGVVAPRDVIGCVNIRAIGQHRCLLSGLSLPTTIKYLRPSGRSSSSGHLASSSGAPREAAGRVPTAGG